MKSTVKIITKPYTIKEIRSFQKLCTKYNNKSMLDEITLKTTSKNCNIFGVKIVNNHIYALSYVQIDQGIY